MGGIALGAPRYTGGGWVALLGTLNAGSSRTTGCLRSSCISEVARAGTANPSAVPLHSSARSGRQPAVEPARAMYFYRAPSAAVVAIGGRVRILLSWESPLATRRITAAANASMTRRIAVVAATARTGERGGR